MGGQGAGQVQVGFDDVQRAFQGGQVGFDKQARQFDLFVLGNLFQPLLGVGGRRAVEPAANRGAGEDPA